MVACALCARTLPSMKRCTRCRAVLYCGRECQVKHWAAHKSACNQLPEDMRERAHKLAGHVKLQAPPVTGMVPTPSWKLGAPSDLDWARMEHGGAETRGKCSLTGFRCGCCCCGCGCNAAATTIAINTATTAYSPSMQSPRAPVDGERALQASRTPTNPPRCPARSSCPRAKGWCQCRASCAAATASCSARCPRKSLSRAWRAASPALCSASKLLRPSPTCARTLCCLPARPRWCRTEPSGHGRAWSLAEMVDRPPTRLWTDASARAGKLVQTAAGLAHVRKRRAITMTVSCVPCARVVLRPARSVCVCVCVCVCVSMHVCANALVSVYCFACVVSNGGTFQRQ